MKSEVNMGRVKHILETAKNSVIIYSLPSYYKAFKSVYTCMQTFDLLTTMQNSVNN